MYMGCYSENNELLQLQSGMTTRLVDSKGRIELYSVVLMASGYIGKVLNIFSHEEDTNYNTVSCHCAFI